jgi:hypothetical protein
MNCNAGKRELVVALQKFLMFKRQRAKQVRDVRRSGNDSNRCPVFCRPGYPPQTS